MAVVTLNDNYQLNLPEELAERAGLAVGERFSATVEDGRIMLTPESLVEQRIEEALDDVSNGRVYGPFSNARELTESLKANAERLKAEDEAGR